MVAGVLSSSGSFMGDSLNPPNETNPKGRFEDREVNQINEALLANALKARHRKPVADWILGGQPGNDQCRLGRLAVGMAIPKTREIAERIVSLAEREPFCFRDPRFSYPLASWRSRMRDPLNVCIFRDPSATASSILKQVRTVPHLRNLRISARQALAVWELMYTHILDVHQSQGGDWLFLQYNQLLDGSAYEILDESLGTTSDRCFTEARLNRSSGEVEVKRRHQELYARLCTLSGYAGEVA